MKLWQKVFSDGSVLQENCQPLHCSFAYQTYDTPCGLVLLLTYEDAICSLEFVVKNIEYNFQSLSKRYPRSNFFHSCEPDLLWKKFLLGENLSLLLYGTLFSLSVWRSLLRIASGQLVSYQHIANSIDHPKAHRAVASAVGSNPIAWIVPCHRVIQKNGTLGGYHYGVNIKKYLISSEKLKTS